MKILITGATGLVGKTITKKLLDQGHSLNILTRNPVKAKETFKDLGAEKLSKLSFFSWNNVKELPPTDAFNDVDSVINLMGENIGDKRWSDAQKEKLKVSRIDATQNLSTVANQFASNINVFISASAIGIYPSNTNEILNENSQIGTGFLPDLCQKWEAATNALNPSIRKVFIRTGVVLDKKGGALKKMLPPFQMGVGGIIGDGKQFMSWIHFEDLANIYIEALHNSKVVGAINGVTNNPVSNYDFTKALGKALARPTLFPVPSVVIKTLFGEMSSIILDSQKVVSIKTDYLNYNLKYPKIEQALENIMKN